MNGQDCFLIRKGVLLVKEIIHLEDVPLCLACCERAGGVYKAGPVDLRLAVTRAELLGVD